MTEIAVRAPESLAAKMEYSRVLASSKLLPRDYQGNPGNILLAFEYADALGIKPIHAITAIHVISGKPSASADLIAALVRREGHKLRVVATDTEATATLIRVDDPEFEYTATWNMARAKTAQLLSNPSWAKYPAAMLRSRAITEVARLGASDALLGFTMTPEEMGADVDAQGRPVVHGGRPEPVAPQRVTAAEIIGEPVDAVIVDEPDDADADAEAEFMQATP